MKKVFRVIVPILLAVAIILCLGWYLFIYDQAFTQDVLLDGARYFEGRGNHQIASWIYDLAYKQADDNDKVAIELAQQHIANGNYTQAEYTLTKAISDGGGVDLYIALCKTYVEQDKLLDAVTMLDTIGNPEIKQQLNDLRPAAPTTNTEAGFYSQYISVAVEAESGTLYVTSDGKYPSVSDPAYTDPIDLKDGENTIYAISIADNGLVSPLSIFGYTIGGVIKELTFVDPAIEAAVRAELGVSENKLLYTNDLWTITSFTVPCEATTFEDLQNFAFLEELIIYAGAPGQLSSISGLANLRRLVVTQVSVAPEELEVIGNLPMLEELVLSDCGLTTTAGLQNAEKLKILDLSSNTIRNIDVLSYMPSLHTLYLQNNTVTDLSPLSGCLELSRLDVSYNALTNLSALSDLKSIRWLNAADNNIRDISELRNLTDLTHLSLASNNITDVTALANCINLSELNISENSISDISFLQNMTRLTQLNFAHNQVSELPTFTEDSMLVHIDGSYNQITTLEQLSGLEYLNNVLMDYNAELESVAELAACHVLIQVNVYGTKVEDITMLTDMSVIVNYDPTVKSE